MNEKVKRSVTKAITWRVIASTSTMILVYLFTGNLEVAIGVGGLHIIVNTILYFLHERAWNLSVWGRKEKK